MWPHICISTCNTRSAEIPSVAVSPPCIPSGHGAARSVHTIPQEFNLSCGRARKSSAPDAAAAVKHTPLSAASAVSLLSRASARRAVAADQGGETNAVDASAQTPSRGAHRPATAKTAERENCNMANQEYFSISSSFSSASALKVFA